MYLLKRVCDPRINHRSSFLAVHRQVLSGEEVQGRHCLLRLNKVLLCPLPSALIQHTCVLVQSVRHIFVIFKFLLLILLCKPAEVCLSVPTAAAKSLQSCLTLSDPMDCGPPGSSIHVIFQARVLEWGAIAFSVSVPKYILKKISPGCSLEELMLKLKLQYFGYLMQRADSFEKTLMLGKIEGRRRRG